MLSLKKKERVNVVESGKIRFKRGPLISRNSSVGRALD